MAGLNFVRDFDYSASVSGEGVEFEESWIVTPSGNVDVTFQAVLSARPDLSPGEDHPTIAGTKVSDLEIQRTGENDISRAVVTYVTNQVGSQRPISPLSLPPVITQRSATIEEPTLFDIDDNPILNTAGDFIVGLTRPVQVNVYTIKVNVKKIPRYTLYMGNAVNIGSFRMRGLDFPDGTLMVTSMSDSGLITDEESGEEYYEMTIEVQYKENGWKRIVPNKGLYELITEVNGTGANKKTTIRKQRITSSDGTPVPSPVALNEEVRRPYTIERDDNGNEKKVPKEKLEPSDIYSFEINTINRRPFSVLLRRS